MRRAVETARAWLPRGATLPRESLVARHRGIVALLWAHVPFLAVMGLLTGSDGPTHTLVEVLPVAALACVASIKPYERTSRYVYATLGLLMASAVGVHLTHGLIEAHFHFFFVIAVIALYQDWIVFLLAIAFVVVHHAALSVLVPKSVFNHEGALENPVAWALIHAAFVLALSVAQVVSWRSSERGSHDSLTGLANAGLLVLRLERALERDAATLIYLDLDGFKVVNDQLGHPAGDRLLAQVARRLESVVRTESCVGRMGGDEFAVVLPGASAEEGRHVAARLVADVARPFLLPGGVAHVGASGGVACAKRGSDAEDVIGAADTAMYAAKAAGKGQVAMALPLSPRLRA